MQNQPTCQANCAPDHGAEDCGLPAVFQILVRNGLTGRMATRYYCEAHEDSAKAKAWPHCHTRITQGPTDAS